MNVVRNRSEERFEIKSASAHDQCFAAAALDVVERFTRQRHVAGDVHSFRWFANVDQVMAHSGPLGRSRLRGPDVHSPIKQQRVARNDFGPVCLRPTQAPFGFPHGRAAGENAKNLVRSGRIHRRENPSVSRRMRRKRRETSFGPLIPAHPSRDTALSKPSRDLPINASRRPRDHARPSRDAR